MSTAAGKAAYEAWAVQMNGYDAGFRFEGLWPEAQARWEAVGAAVIDWYKTNNVVIAAPAEVECSNPSRCDIHGHEADAPVHILSHPGSDRWIGGDKKDDR